MRFFVIFGQSAGVRTITTVRLTRMRIHRASTGEVWRSELEDTEYLVC
jgi:hypothetical protein